MDWDSWNQVGAYNLGTGVTGIILLFLGIRAWIGSNTDLARALAASFALIGIYICYRGLYWFTASHASPDGELYNQTFLDLRWSIWLVIIPMEVALIGLYLRIFQDSRLAEVLIIGAVIGGYVVGGLLG